MGRTVLLLANLAAAPFAVTLLSHPAYGLWALIQAILPWTNLAKYHALSMRPARWPRCPRPPFYRWSHGKRGAYTQWCLRRCSGF